MTTDDGMDVVVTETPSTTIARQAAEIERLREKLADVTSKPFAYCTEPRSEILARQQAEIERLRGLLRESICPPPSTEPVLTKKVIEGFVIWAKDYERRVREALGE